MKKSKEEKGGKSELPKLEGLKEFDQNLTYIQ